MTVSPQLLRLMQLTSPALPVGAFAYSQGLEQGVDLGVQDEQTARSWIFGVLKNGLARLDLPMLARMHMAWRKNDQDEVKQWSARLLASRETMELRREELQTAASLARLLRDLGVDRAASWTSYPKRTFCALYGLAGASWDIETDALCSALAFAWTENQVAATIKLIPVGQTGGQRILSEAATLIPELVAQALSLTDEEMGGTVPGQAMASAQHETKHTRLFRS